MIPSCAATACCRLLKNWKKRRPPAEPRSGAQLVKTYPKVIDRILQSIRENQTFCIVGHIRPDGDCVGSQLAWRWPSKRRQKGMSGMRTRSAKIQISRPRRPVSKAEARPKIRLCHRHGLRQLRAPGQAGQCIADRKLFINIDHHESNTRYADMNWVSAREPPAAN